MNGQTVRRSVPVTERPWISRRNSRKSVFFLVLGIVILLLAVSISALMLVPEFLGYGTLNLESGAMEPAIRRGSLLIVETWTPEEIQPGDVIVFTGDQGTEVRRVTVNHLVSEEFTVQGDAYPEADADPVKYTALSGRVKLQVPYLGSLRFIFQTGMGRIYAAAFALCGLLMILLSASIRRSGREAKLLKMLKEEGYLSDK